jgi:hypothetical protein
MSAAASQCVAGVKKEPSSTDADYVIGEDRAGDGGEEEVATSSDFFEEVTAFSLP